MSDIPRGYDAVCSDCGQPFTFANAKRCNVPHWRHYCSRLCEFGREVNEPPIQGYVRAMCKAIERAYSHGDLETAYGYMDRVERVLGLSDPRAGEAEYASWIPAR